MNLFSIGKIIANLKSKSCIKEEEEDFNVHHLKRIEIRILINKACSYSIFSLSLNSLARGC